MQTERICYEAAIIDVIKLPSGDVIATSGTGSGWSENTSAGSWTPERSW